MHVLAGAAHAFSLSIPGHSPAAAEKSLFMLWRAASEAAGSAFFFAGASTSPACKGQAWIGCGLHSVDTRWPNRQPRSVLSGAAVPCS